MDTSFSRSGNLFSTILLKISLYLHSIVYMGYTFTLSSPHSLKVRSFHGVPELSYFLLKCVCVCVCVHCHWPLQSDTISLSCLPSLILAFSTWSVLLVRLSTEAFHWLIEVSISSVISVGSSSVVLALFSYFHFRLPYFMHLLVLFIIVYSYLWIVWTRSWSFFWILCLKVPPSHLH